VRYCNTFRVPEASDRPLRIGFLRSSVNCHRCWILNCLVRLIPHALLIESRPQGAVHSSKCRTWRVALSLQLEKTTATRRLSTLPRPTRSLNGDPAAQSCAQAPKQGFDLGMSASACVVIYLPFHCVYSASAPHHQRVRAFKRDASLLSETASRAPAGPSRRRRHTFHSALLADVITIILYSRSFHL
jgi:hypothetical protein